MDKEKILNFFSHLPVNEVRKYRSVLEFLEDALPAGLIDSKTYAISFVDDKGMLYTFSLLDYLYCVISSEEIPPPAINAFHKHMLQEFNFPCFIISNKNMM